MTTRRDFEKVGVGNAADALFPSSELSGDPTASSSPTSRAFKTTMASVPNSLSATHHQMQFVSPCQSTSFDPGSGASRVIRYNLIFESGRGWPT